MRGRFFIRLNLADEKDDETRGISWVSKTTSSRFIFLDLWLLKFTTVNTE